MLFNSRQLGQIGEDLAVKTLRRKGYAILHRNFRTRSGEIDIIAEYDDVIIFIEVKSRRSTFLQTPLEAITYKKRKQISRVAQEYLSRKGNVDCGARFDVVAVNLYSSSKPVIEHIEGAFDYC